MNYKTSDMKPERDGEKKDDEQKPRNTERAPAEGDGKKDEKKEETLGSFSYAADQAVDPEGMPAVTIQAKSAKEANEKYEKMKEEYDRERGKKDDKGGE